MTDSDKLIQIYKIADLVAYADYLKENKMHVPELHRLAEKFHLARMNCHEIDVRIRQASRQRLLDLGYFSEDNLPPLTVFEICASKGRKSKSQGELFSSGGPSMPKKRIIACGNQQILSRWYFRFVHDLKKAEMLNSADMHTMTLYCRNEVEGIFLLGNKAAPKELFVIPFVYWVVW